MQDLCTRSLKELFCTYLLKRSLGRISEQDLHHGFLGKISVQAPSKRSLGSRKTQGQVARANIDGKMQVTSPFPASLRNHMDISQEPFCVEISIYREKAGRESRGLHFARACEVETHMDISQEPCRMENLQGKCRTRIRQPAFCARLSNRNAHGYFTRAISYANFQGKCRTRMPGPAFCASLRSRHALGHFTIAMLYGN